MLPHIYVPMLKVYLLYICENVKLTWLVCPRICLLDILRKYLKALRQIRIIRRRLQNFNYEQRSRIIIIYGRGLTIYEHKMLLSFFTPHRILMDFLTHPHWPPNILSFIPPPWAPPPSVIKAWFTHLLHNTIFYTTNVKHQNPAPKVWIRRVWN